VSTPARAHLSARVREGCEAAFAEAWRESAEAIGRVAGCVRVELLRDPADPRAVLATTTWADERALREFHRGSLWARVTARLRELGELEGEQALAVLEEAAGRGPRIRVTVSTTVAEHEVQAFQDAYVQVAAHMRGTPGHVREELLRDPGTTTFHLFAEWEDEASFQAWVADPGHRDETGPVAEFLDRNMRRHVQYIAVLPGEFTHIAEPEEAGVKSNVDVVVVGAGPTGLTTAIELARRGVAVRVLEKAPTAAGNADKAIGVHIRTMEIWEDQGVVRRAMDAGIWLTGQSVYVNGERVVQQSWDLPDLPYAHLGLPQYETERILTDRLAELGVAVERGAELLEFSQDDEGVTTQLVDAHGRLGTVRSRYLVGCDGAHSVVRARLGLTFEGGLGRFPQLFMLGDVELDWDLPRTELIRFVQLADDGEMKGMLVCVPLKGEGRFRLATVAPPRYWAQIGGAEAPAGFTEELTVPTLADLQTAVDQLAPAGTRASNLRWSSVFRISHGIVDRYRVGRVLVAGDAAHLHPPAGGQGMNTGIHDGYNLGWKLALAVRGLGSDELLDSYEAERRPAGKEVVDRAVSAAFTDELQEDLDRQFLTEMHMLLRYEQGPLVGEATGAELPGGPRPGERAPDVGGLTRVGVGRPLQLGDLLRGGAHTLLFYADRTTPEEDLVATEKIAAAAREQAHGTLDAYLLLGPDALPPTAAYPPVVTDAAGGFRRHYGLRGPATFLVRPDGYVGFRGSGYPADALREHLARTFRASS